MLKILDRSWIAERKIAYSKLFEGLVTGYTDKYRFDAFFRTQVNIIALQILFAVVMLVMITGAFDYFHRDLVNAFSRTILEKIAIGEPLHSEEILQATQAAETSNFLLIFAFVIVMTGLLGYIISRVALTPTRNALTAQKQFIGNIAHELRTPLSIIKTNAEVALFDETLDVRLRKSLKSTVEELDRASEIINNLLSFNSLTRPEQVEFKNVDLGHVIDTVTTKLSPLAQQKQIGLTVKKSEFRTVWGNMTALEQIVMNIIKNAINYTPAGGYVSITLEPDYRGSIEIAVRDTGIGIARKDLFRIFEPFFRADKSRSREHGGSGLGLTIVSEIVKMHHGRIFVRSAPHRGTTVTVFLPCGQSPEFQRAPGGGVEGLDEVSIDFTSRKTNVPTP